MDSDTLWQHIDQEREELCVLLTALDESQWRSRSLCSEWTVRDVSAHLTFAQTTLPEMFLPLVRAGFRFDTAIRDVAVHSPLGHTEIIERIRGFRGSRRRPPFVTEVEPLADVLVHTQDICVPLGLEHPVPSEAGIVALERLLELNHTWLRLRPPLDGVRLAATDADWASGAGPTVEGPLRWLLLLAAGRDSARTHLTGALEAV